MNAEQIVPRGFEPLSKNRQPVDNTKLTENKNPVLSTSLDKILQNQPELEALITAWPNLPDAIKQAIKTLVETARK